MNTSSIFEVYKDKKNIYTRNLVPGKDVYGERLIRDKGIEYRQWNPARSKLAAAIMKGCTNTGIRKGDTILYLGAASGTTPSHISDMIGEEGFMFALEFSARSARDLIFLCEERKNMAPILADANNIDSFSGRICKVDYIYQDIAQSNQTEIFLKNCRNFLKKGGFALIAVKSRSIDIRQKPKNIYKKVRDALEKEMTIIDYKVLDPYEKDHCVFICKR